MSNLLSKVKSLFGVSAEAVPAAPDGDHDTLKSGKWAALQSISIEHFPQALLLTAQDKALSAHVHKELVLSSVKVGPHLVELLLCSAGKDLVDLSLRVPTAKNQFKDPYILMEAEAGNSREDAVREIEFHLRGRVSDKDLSAMNWASVLAAASTKLEALRKRH